MKGAKAPQNGLRLFQRHAGCATNPSSSIQIERVGEHVDRQPVSSHGNLPFLNQAREAHAYPPYTLNLSRAFVTTLTSQTWRPNPGSQPSFVSTGRCGFLGRRYSRNSIADLMAFDDPRDQHRRFSTHSIGPSPNGVELRSRATSRPSRKQHEADWDHRASRPTLL